MAPVGVTESLLTMIYAIAFGFSMGTTALVARRMGEKRPDEAAVAESMMGIVGAIVFRRGHWKSRQV